LSTIDQVAKFLHFIAVVRLLHFKPQEQRIESLQRMEINLQNPEFFLQLAHQSHRSFEQGDAIGLLRSRQFNRGNGSSDFG
jgi:hypothetical protein